MKRFYLHLLGVYTYSLCLFTFPFALQAQTSSINIFDYRTLDGSFNDLYNPEEGKAGNEFIRMHAKSYYFKDGNSMMDRGNVRRISNQMFNQYISRPDPNQLSSMVFTFLQFLDHDITFTKQGHTEFSPILIPKGDPQFDPYATGQQTMSFTRVATSSKNATQRQQINEITAWIDASNVYGSDEKRATWLRSGDCGKLKVSPSPYGDLLPCNTTTGDCNDPLDINAPSMDQDRDRQGQAIRVFVAGDIRANEQPGLTALHTLFVREHNRICDQLAIQYGCDDEHNYQRARKIVGGLIQSITYNELLPLLGIDLENDRYAKKASGDILNSFATAGYRLGHTMITENLPLVNGNCAKEAVYDLIPLQDAFFNPAILFDHGIDPILNGVASQTQEAIDPKVISAVRNFLFGTLEGGGLDLAALNIQRGRDHGLPDYNSLRVLLGLPYANSFRQITQNDQIAATLEDIYESVNDIDAWVGMLSEPPLPNKAVGETIHALLGYQFNNLRKADRFYYTRDPILQAEEKKEISNTRLADIINRNSSLTHLKDVFINTSSCIPPPATTNIVTCNEVLIKHDESGLLSIQGAHNMEYGYQIARDPKGLVSLYKCLSKCGDSYETTLPVGTHYIKVKNKRNRTICETTIKIKPAIATARITPPATTNAALNVFPNPATALLNIEVVLPKEEPTMVYIINALGQVVHEHTTIATSTYQVNIAHLPSGVYEVLMRSNTSDWQLYQKLSIL